MTCLYTLLDVKTCRAGPGGSRRASGEGADLKQAGLEASPTAPSRSGADVRAGRLGQPQERRSAGCDACDSLKRRLDSICKIVSTQKSELFG